MSFLACNKTKWRAAALCASWNLFISKRLYFCTEASDGFQAGKSLCWSPVSRCDLYNCFHTWSYRCLLQINKYPSLACRVTPGHCVSCGLLDPKLTLDDGFSYFSCYHTQALFLPFSQLRGASSPGQCFTDPQLLVTPVSRASAEPRYQPLLHMVFWDCSCGRVSLQSQPGWKKPFSGRLDFGLWALKVAQLRAGRGKWGRLGSLCWWVPLPSPTGC